MWVTCPLSLSLSLFFFRSRPPGGSQIYQVLLKNWGDVLVKIVEKLSGQIFAHRMWSMAYTISLTVKCINI